MKNVCQTCVFDLEYGLPVAVRDHALSLKDDIPTGDFNKEHFHENLGKELALQGDDLRGAHSAPNAFLERLSGLFLFLIIKHIIHNLYATLKKEYANKTFQSRSSRSLL